LKKEMLGVRSDEGSKTKGRIGRLSTVDDEKNTEKRHFAGPRGNEKTPKKTRATGEWRGNS